MSTVHPVSTCPVFSDYVLVLTLKRGHRLLVAVEYDGLLGSSSAVLASRVVLIVETLHVELKMAVTIKPEVLEGIGY